MHTAPRNINYDGRLENHKQDTLGKSSLFYHFQYWNYKYRSKKKKNSLLNLTYVQQYSMTKILTYEYRISITRIANEHCFNIAFISFMLKILAM